MKPLTKNDRRAQLAWLYYYQDVERFNRTLPGQMYDGIWRVSSHSMASAKEYRRRAVQQIVIVPLGDVDAVTVGAWKDRAAATPFDSIDAMIELVNEWLSRAVDQRP